MPVACSPLPNAKVTSSPQHNVPAEFARSRLLRCTALSRIYKKQSLIPHKVRRSRHTQATALSVPTESFRTNYPELDIDQCDSLRDLQLSQEVLDLLPRGLILDPRATGPCAGLDTLKLTELNNALSAIWSVSARRRPTPLATAIRHQPLAQAANQLAEQCAVFCERVETMYSATDVYVLNCLCHQVIEARPNSGSVGSIFLSCSQDVSCLQLVWNSVADMGLKARVCANMSGKMASHAYQQISKVVQS